jgi:hypothetical protein
VRPAILFKSAAIEGDRLYLTTKTEVLILSWPDLRLIHHLSHPAFGDVHHAAPHGDRLLVACSGVDLVVEFDASYDAVAFHPVIDDSASNFSADVDYRKIATHLVRSAHPNFVFFLDGQPWVTRSAQKDAVCLEDRTKRIEIAVERVHDGNVVGDFVYFTTVDGHVVVADGRTHRIEATYDLLSISEKDAPLGWSRGIHIEGELAYVGFSRIRPTRLYENVRWVKAQMKALGTAPTELLPTRIGVYDLARGVLLDEILLEDAGIAAVYSVLPSAPSPLPRIGALPSADENYVTA